MARHSIGRTNLISSGYENELLATEIGAHGEKRAGRAATAAA
jgi:hypothetical protein